MNQQELELLWAYQQEDMAADRIANEIRRSPTRQKLEKTAILLLSSRSGSSRSRSKFPSWRIG